MRQLLVLLGLTCLAPCVATAQTKVSASCHSVKPQPPPQHWMRIGDHADHMIGISQVENTCPKPSEIEGLQFKESVNPAFLDRVGVLSASAEATLS